MLPGLLITQGKKIGLYLKIEEGKPFWIGRLNSTNFPLEGDQLVSGKHCFLLRRGTQIAIKDESTNGTFVNGCKIHKTTILLKYADIIRIGATHFQVVDVDETSSPSEELIDYAACMEDAVKQEKLTEKGTHYLSAFGPYLNIEVIGSGAAGTVYKSIHKDLKKIVALKVISNFDEMSEQFVGRFLREIELLKQLDHPNVIKLYDTGKVEMEGEERDYIALEYFPGVNLNNHVKTNGSMSWKKTMRILHQSLSALKHMHSKGVLHRDLKPGNIMYNDAKGIAKIIDLGLGKSVLSEERKTLCITTPDSVMGTPNFMPYEQWSGMKKVNEKADIYSLGATAYFLLSGVLPYGKHRDFTQIYRSVLKRQLVPLEELCQKDTPPHLLEIIDGMMEFEAEKRYPDCSPILEELERIASKLAIELN